MCLIIVTTGKKLHDTLFFTPGLMRDIFETNPDGLGAMYTTSKGKLRTPKIMPRSLHEVESFFHSLPPDERQVAVHFRQRTHGATDISQCHPYDVIPGKIAMMHNGILPHGNAPDKSKSDTWHYINGYLAPLLEVYPKAFTNIGVQNLIESDISDANRFVIMDNTGEMVILNRETGIEYDGIWFSNTYAWSPEMLIPGYAKPPRWTGGRADLYGGEWWNRPTTGYQGSSSGGVGPLDDDEEVNLIGVEAADPGTRIADMEQDIWEALADADTEFMTILLEDNPRFTLATLFKYMQYQPTLAEGSFDTLTARIISWLENADLDLLVDDVMQRGHAEQVSEAICWYGAWVEGSPMPKAAVDEPASELYAA